MNDDLTRLVEQARELLGEEMYDESTIPHRLLLAGLADAVKRLQNSRASVVRQRDFYERRGERFRIERDEARARVAELEAECEQLQAEGEFGRPRADHERSLHTAGDVRELMDACERAEAREAALEAGIRKAVGFIYTAPDSAWTALVDALADGTETTS